VYNDILNDLPLLMLQWFHTISSITTTAGSKLLKRTRMWKYCWFHLKTWNR